MINQNIILQTPLDTAYIYILIFDASLFKTLLHINKIGKRIVMLN